MDLIYHKNNCRKILKSSLNLNEKIIYNSVRQLLNGDIISFSTSSEDGLQHFMFYINKNVKNGNFYYCKSYTASKSYTIKFIPEYDNYNSKFTNFDNILIHMLMWYHNLLDEYLLLKERKEKLININSL